MAGRSAQVRVMILITIALTPWIVKSYRDCFKYAYVGTSERWILRALVLVTVGGIIAGWACADKMTPPRDPLLVYQVVALLTGICSAFALAACARSADYYGGVFADYSDKSRTHILLRPVMLTSATFMAVLATFVLMVLGL